MLAFCAGRLAILKSLQPQPHKQTKPALLVIRERLAILKPELLIKRAGGGVGFIVAGFQAKAGIAAGFGLSYNMGKYFTADPAPERRVRGAHGLYFAVGFVEFL